MSEDPFGLGFFVDESEQPEKRKTRPDSESVADQLGELSPGPLDEEAEDLAAEPSEESPIDSITYSQPAMEATWAVPDPEPEPVVVSSPTSQSTDEQQDSFSVYLQSIAERRDLSRAEAAAALEQIVAGKVSDIETSAFLMGLRVKGETSHELAGMLQVMRDHVVAVGTPHQDALIDIVGTGGDHLGTFNISTAAAFVVAGAGVKVAKHGNRAASSRCGSADVLEALGVRTDLTPGEVATCIDEVGMGFMFAPRHHPAMGKVADVRRALGVRTVFNLLGPLTNPAGAQRLLLGVSSVAHLDVIAGALAQVGCKHALLVHGDEGMDELSVCSGNTIVEVERGVVQPPYSLAPEECGVQRWALRGLQGGDPAANAFVIKGVFGGSGGAPRDAVIFNAGAALFIAGAVSAIREGIDLAAEIVADGRAAKVLNDLVALTNRLAEGRV
jgi:anthranilate phosphoribosyltransferase